VKHRVYGVCFCRFCLCCGLVLGIRFSSRCEDTVVCTGVELVLVFARVACPAVRKKLTCCQNKNITLTSRADDILFLFLGPY